MNPRLRLIIAAGLFFGWLGWLSYTALTKSNAPIVSRAQAAAASVPVVADLTTGEDGRVVFLVRGDGLPTQLKEKADKPAYLVKVTESLKDGPKAGEQIGVINLPISSGYTGPGQYLLLLNAEKDAKFEKHKAYTLVGQQRSPGADLADVGPPKIYSWSPDVRDQVKRLYP